ncbi:MAG TPA: hypothetical protein VGO41_02105 [Steroidobacteraceae bacterium]|jgi:hypothetical protein|nr:hypothetical protein [Steroidobacteraceae bacterium]
MERFLLAMDEVDEYLGLVRHLVVGVAADCSDLASRAIIALPRYTSRPLEVATDSVAAQLIQLRIRIRGLN